MRDLLLTVLVETILPSVGLQAFRHVMLTKCSFYDPLNVTPMKLTFPGIQGKQKHPRYIRYMKKGTSFSDTCYIGLDLEEHMKAVTIPNFLRGALTHPCHSFTGDLAECLFFFIRNVFQCHVHTCCKRHKSKLFVFDRPSSYGQVFIQDSRGRLNIKCHLTSIGIPLLKIRPSHL